MSVTITKSGNTPAKVEVHKGDESWTVNEDELDKLPESVRSPVQGLLGRAILTATVELAPGDAAKEESRGEKQSPGDAAKAESRGEKQPAPSLRATRVRPDLDSRLERDLGEVERQLSALREQLEDLRAERRHAGDRNSPGNEQPDRPNRKALQDREPQPEER